MKILVILLFKTKMKLYNLIVDIPHINRLDVYPNIFILPVSDETLWVSKTFIGKNDQTVKGGGKGEAEHRSSALML